MNQKVRVAAMAAITGVGMALSGCALSPLESQQLDAIKVAPVPASYKEEVTLAKLTDILSSMELTPEQRARFLYDRGVSYDRLGMRILSRIDFIQALKLQPNLADAYNFLGIYYTQENEYESAYEAFDAVLELSPDYDYAYLNRGISLYYGQRTELALLDMRTFYNLDKSDGYRVLWLYLVERENDEKAAIAKMADHRIKLNSDTWSSALVDYYLGLKSEAAVFALAKKGLKQPDEYAERLCEAYFYMAKRAQQLGNHTQAATYFKLALATNVYDFVEHRYARLELERGVAAANSTAN